MTKRQGTITTFLTPSREWLLGQIKAAQAPGADINEIAIAIESAYAQTTALSVPVETWRDRDENSTESIFEFIRRVYGDQIDSGRLTQADLRRIDFSACQALVNACSYRGLKAADFVPARYRRFSKAENEKIIREDSDALKRYHARSRMRTGRRQKLGSEHNDR